MKVLSKHEILQKLEVLPGWDLTPEGIRKCYELDSFMAVIRLVNRVAEVAEQADHHPDILINYNKVVFTLITHDAGGITRKDLDLAALIEGIVSREYSGNKP